MAVIRVADLDRADHLCQRQHVNGSCPGEGKTRPRCNGFEPDAVPTAQEIRLRGTLKKKLMIARWARVRVVFEQLEQKPD